MSEFELKKANDNLTALSADSEDQTIQSSTSSDIYGDILPNAWGSLDEAEAFRNVRYFSPSSDSYYFYFCIILSINEY